MCWSNPCSERVWQRKPGKPHGPEADQHDIRFLQCYFQRIESPFGRKSIAARNRSYGLDSRPKVDPVSPAPSAGFVYLSAEELTHQNISPFHNFFRKSSTFITSMSPSTRETGSSETKMRRASECSSLKAFKPVL